MMTIWLRSLPVVHISPGLRQRREIEGHCSHILRTEIELERKTTSHGSDPPQDGFPFQHGPQYHPASVQVCSRWTDRAGEHLMPRELLSRIQARHMLQTPAGGDSTTTYRNGRLMCHLATK